MRGWKVFTKMFLFAFVLFSTKNLYSLSPAKMEKYFWVKNNRVISTTMSKDRLKVKWDLQYLIWKTWVSSYLNLSKEHQDIVKKIADILLTDEYAENIEENKKHKTRNYDIVSSWEKDLKTSHLWIFIKRAIFLLQDVQEIRKSSQRLYKNLLKSLDEYKEKKWYSPNPKLYTVLKTLEPKIQAVLKVHEFLDQKGLAKEMDYRKKEDAIKAEIAKIEAEIRDNNDIIKWQESKIKWQESKIKWLDKDIKSQEKKIKELNAYIKTLNKFLDLKK